MAESKELLAKEKQELATRGEQMQPGLVFTPPVDIFETDREITVLADMPGVAADGIKIDLQNDVLTLSGDVKPWENAGESDVLVEFEIGKYYRQFTLPEVIDQNKIEAGLENGVLRLNLPKSEKALPRQIAVKTA
jgi:HSP20 family molecular chaperone IbpA